MTSLPWLTVLWLVPAVGAIAVALLPAGPGQVGAVAESAGQDRRQGRSLQAGVAVSLVTLGWSIAMAVAFPGSPGTRFGLTESHRWIPAIGARYELGLDGVGLVLVLLTTALVPLLLLGAWHAIDASQGDPRIYVALTLAVQAMVLLSFVATDILLFYLVFEALRNRWDPSRSDGARAMQGLSANLCVLRDLRKQVFGWGVVWRWRNVAPV